MNREAIRRYVVALLCGLVALSVCSVAEARGRRRGPSPAQIKKMKEQVAYMQLEMVRYQSEMAAKQQEIYRSFDENADGKLTAGEKARYDKHMHAIQKGTEPNPFAAIAPVGKGPRPKSPIDELQKKASQYRSDMFAKQQEIFRSFDDNSNGHLEGAEKARFDKHMHDIQTGAVPNPFAAAGAGSHDESKSKAKK